MKTLLNPEKLIIVDDRLSIAWKEDVLETIQWISGILIQKGISTAPVSIDYLETKVAPGMEVLVVKELILRLKDLFIEYTQKTGKIHKYSKYVASFTKEIEKHQGNSLYGKRLV